MAELGRKWDELLGGVHDLGDAHGPTEDPMPWTVRRRDGRTGEKKNVGVAKTLAQRTQALDLDRRQGILIDDDEAHGSTVPFLCGHEPSLTRSVSADGVVADLAQRGPDQRATPVVGHDDQDAWRESVDSHLEMLTSQRGIPRAIFSAFA